MKEAWKIQRKLKTLFYCQQNCSKFSTYQTIMLQFIGGTDGNVVKMEYFIQGSALQGTILKAVSRSDGIEWDCLLNRSKNFDEQPESLHVAVQMCVFHHYYYDSQICFQAPSYNSKFYVRATTLTVMLLTLTKEPAFYRSHQHS